MRHGARRGPAPSRSTPAKAALIVALVLMGQVEPAAPQDAPLFVGKPCGQDLPFKPEHIRVVFRFNRSVLAREDFRAAFNPSVLLPASVFAGVDREGPPEPVFTARKGLLDRLRTQAPTDGFTDEGESRLILYYQVFVRDVDSAERLRSNLAALTQGHDQGLITYVDVELAVQAETLSPLQTAPWPSCPAADLKDYGATGELEGCQQHLAEATPTRRSLDARYAWSFHGGRGEGTRLLLIDDGLGPGHEDFPSIVNMSPTRYSPHGNASLGVCCADASDRLGVSGVASATAVAFAHVWDAQDRPNAANTILRATEWLDEGDVLVLELQSMRCENGINMGHVPMEAFGDTRDAIEEAVKAGIYVIEAAGNGRRNLDKVPGVTTSGPAIMVGAAHPTTGKINTGLNHGTRVDVHGWDRGVVSTGGPRVKKSTYWCDLQCRKDGDRCYMSDFNATSAATAMIGGAVASLSGIIQNSLGRAMSPPDMKDLLRRSCLAPPTGSTTCQPNLRQAVADLQARGYKLNPR
jgi:hypothetical protein